MSFQENLLKQPSLFVRQKKELLELLNYETRNKYSIETADKVPIGFAAEQQKGIGGFLLRQFLGHWRSFEILIFDMSKQIVLKVFHPFRFFFQRLEVFSNDGQLIGAIQQRFAIFSKKFDVLDAQENLLLSVHSGIFKLWTFPFMKNGSEAAVIRKKWGGLFKEAFLDADSFQIEFGAVSLTLQERSLILAAGIFIDLQYFEKKAR